MKSFSTSRFDLDADSAEARRPADPTAGFSNVQWFLHACRNTIYYTAFQSLPFDWERTMATSKKLVELAPQLATGFVGARPGQPLSDEQIAAVTTLEEVDSLENYPQAWLQSGEEVYDTPGLPLFRFMVVNRRGGPDAEGRASMVQVIASHALLEGSDSAILARSQDSSHGYAVDRERRLPLIDRIKVGAIAGITAVGHFFAGHVAAPSKMTMAFDGQVFERHDIRTAANALGVSQRALVYAVAIYALFERRKRAVSALYTILGGSRRDTDDEFIRARGINARFPLAGRSLPDFVVEVDASMKRYEARPEGHDQFVLNALYGIHRRVSRALPFLYPPRWFRFPGMYDIVLTMTPPHRIVGSFMEGVIEPIYAGSYHEGLSLITFVPSRRQVTVNFTVPPQLAGRIARVPGLIAELAKAQHG